MITGFQHIIIDDNSFPPAMDSYSLKLACDVELGGATVFPLAGVRVPAVKVIILLSISFTVIEAARLQQRQFCQI